MVANGDIITIVLGMFCSVIKRLLMFIKSLKGMT